MKLRQLAGTTQNSSNDNPELSAIAVNELIEAAPILEVAEFYTHSGNADKPRKGAATVGGSSRALNADFVGNVATPQFGDVALKIIGDKVIIDRAHQRRGQDIGSVVIEELQSVARGIGRHFMDLFVNADSDAVATVFNGLKKQIVGSDILLLEAAENGAQVILGNDNAAKRSQQMFKLYIDQLLAEVGGASFLLANRKTLGYLRAIGMEYVRSANMQDIFSNAGNRLIGDYFGVPVFDAGYKKDNATPVIGNDEVQGTSENCTSIYAGKFGEKADLTFATNIGLEVKDLGLVGAQRQISIELDTDLVRLSPACAKRLAGIRLA